MGITIPLLNGDERMLIVITYDIKSTGSNGQKRLQKIAALCKDSGIRVQKSVYECEMDIQEYRNLKARLEELIDPEEDNIRFYILGNHYENRIDSIGQQSTALDWKTFVL